MKELDRAADSERKRVRPSIHETTKTRRAVRPYSKKGPGETVINNSMKGEKKSALYPMARSTNGGGGEVKRGKIRPKSVRRLSSGYKILLNGNTNLGKTQR